MIVLAQSNYDFARARMFERIGHRFLRYPVNIQGDGFIAYSERPWAFATARDLFVRPRR